ncbi:hypothetical protein [Emticicia sp. SJ17W-69]|uniref:hypothetical protein n=1 Tax=Emticicia sp. SJ17W-69 TaxID=3421657 RepID=UPI003EB87BEC
MKKLLLLFLITSSFSAKSQNAYYDALMLNSKKDSIKIVYDSLSSPKYQHFYELDKIIQFIKEKKIYSQEEFTKIYKFSNNENIFLKDLPQLNRIKLQNQFIAYKIYVKFKNKQDSILKVQGFNLKSHKDKINNIWNNTQFSIDSLFKNDTTNCFYKFNSSVISVKSVVKAQNNNKNVLFFFNPKIRIPIPSILPIFNNNLVLKDSIYFYVANSDLSTCDNENSNKLSNLLFKKNDIINKVNIDFFAKLKNLKISYDETNDEFKKNGVSIIKDIESPNKALEGSRTITTSGESISANQKANNPTITGTSFDPTTRIIDATSKWLVKRTKEELTMSFYDKFREKLESEEDIRQMLPATYMMLRNQENIYQMPNLGKVWARAFVSDIKQIPFNFEALVNQKYQDIAHENEFLLFMTAAHSFDMLGKGTHPAEVFDYLNNTYGGLKDNQGRFKTVGDTIVKQTIRLVDLLSKNLRDTASATVINPTIKTKRDTIPNDRAWILGKDLAKLNDPTIRKFYLGLLYQQDPQLFDDIKIEKSKEVILSLKDYFTSNNNFQYVDKTLSQVLQFFNNIDAQLKTLKDSKQEKQNTVNFVQYAQLVFDVVDIGFRVKYLISEPNPDNSYYTSEYFKTWRPTGVNAIEGIKAFYNNNLGAGFMHSLLVIKPIWDKIGKTNANIEKIADAFEIIGGFDRAILANQETIANTNIKRLNTDIIAINNRSSFGKAEINQLKTKYDDLKTINKELADIKDKIETYKQNLTYLDSYFLLSNGGAFKDIEDKIQQKNADNIKLKNVSVAVNNIFLYGLLQSVLAIKVDDLKKLKKKQENLCKIFINKNKDATDDSEKKKVVLDQFIFYANFITDIITADSTANLEDIINRYAQPVGSYSIKRKNRWSIDVNAYPGLYAGIENPLGTSQLRQNNFINGITAPIGISLSKGKLQKGYKDNVIKGHSWSLFIPVIDIGAAFSYRWTNTSEDGQGLPKIKLSQIFSPGLYVAYGFKNFPISIMAGAQYTPQLREIIKTSKDTTITTTTENGITKSVETIYNLSTKTEVNTWRYGVSANVDISIFNLFHQRRKNK